MCLGNKCKKLFYISKTQCLENGSNTKRKEESNESQQTWSFLRSKIISPMNSWFNLSSSDPWRRLNYYPLNQWWAKCKKLFFQNFHKIFFYRKLFGLLLERHLFLSNSVKVFCPFHCCCCCCYRSCFCH